MDAQAKGEFVVQLDGQQMGGAGGQSLCDGAAAGADFDHCTAGQIADGSRDALDSGGIDEEVLAELGFDLHGIS